MVRHIFSNKEGLPFWKSQRGTTAFRDHIAALRIPDIGGLPSLLVHELGRVTHDDQLAARVSELFRQDSNNPK
jgi:hypothetical protein